MSISTFNQVYFAIKIHFYYVFIAELAKTNPKFIAKDGQLTIGSGQVVIPESQCVKPESQNKPRRSKLDILQDILGEEKDPVCLMCQALNIEERTREALDMNLARKCQSLEPLRKFDGGFFDNIGRRSSGRWKKIQQQSN